MVDEREEELDGESRVALSWAGIFKFFARLSEAEKQAFWESQKVSSVGRGRKGGFLTPKDVADTLTISIDMVYALIKSGNLPALRFQKDHGAQRHIYRIRLEDFQEFLKRSEYYPNIDEEGDY